MITLSIVAFVIFVLYFTIEKQKDKLVIISIMTSLGVVGRLAFAIIPSVQLATFVIIITGLVFGKRVGFVVGSLVPLVSNFILGQGIWTLWQMIGFALIGLISAILISFRNNRYVLSCFGFIAGILYGWIMNTMTLFYNNNFFMACVASFYFDCMHGISNAVMLFLFGNLFIELIEQV